MRNSEAVAWTLVVVLVLLLATIFDGVAEVTLERNWFRDRLMKSAPCGEPPAPEPQKFWI